MAIATGSASENITLVVRVLWDRVDCRTVLRSFPLKVFHFGDVNGVDMSPSGSQFKHQTLDIHIMQTVPRSKHTTNLAANQCFKVGTLS